MKLSIVAMEIENFKGKKSEAYKFGNTNKIVGANGTGKTTIATAWLWLMADRDYDLNGNPAIRTIGVEECSPRVSVTVDVDGKMVTLTKIQKRTVSKPNADGVSKVSLSNSYEINSVPKNERDFKAYLEELGFDGDKFLALSHADVFTSQKSADMRKVLFAMASSKSESEVASVTDGAVDVATLLKNYTLEEVSAMQKATLKKILEVYGKEGEILKAKIEGLESAKVDMDISAIELSKADVKRKLNECQLQLDALESLSAKAAELSNDIMQMKFDQSDMVRNSMSDLDSIRRDKEDEIRVEKRKRDLKQSELDRVKSDISILSRRIDDNVARVQALRETYTSKKALKFDTKSAVCPLCKREYDASKVAELKAEFEAQKQTEIDSLQAEGNALVESNKADKAELKKLNATFKSLSEELDELDFKIASLELEFKSLPVNANVIDTDAYKALSKLIEEKQNELLSLDVNGKRVAIKAEEMVLQNQYTEFEKQIALFNGNDRIDDQIADLRTKQIEYEQSKADAEKVLYQVELVRKKMNELLTDEINSYFKLVSFEMFEYAKNGNYKECCNVYLDGKKFGESTNTGREKLAQLDIISGLQSFYNQFLPVFLDGAECLSSDTMSRISMDNQMIYLIVGENKELEVKA